MQQTHELSATELTAAYRTGDLSPVDALKAATARIEDKDALHRGMYVVDTDGATRAARASEERWRRGQQLGPLDGVPVTLKENTPVIGFHQSLGTAARHPRPAEVNSPVTDRLLEAGAVIVGSTTMPDLSGLGSGVSSRHGTARNPWNPAWNTGGSSSGAAVATAFGYGAINIGTDIGGSIRLPASFTGVFGFKPSYGRVPILDTYLGRVAGPMTRTVADAAAAMTYLSRPDRRDCASLPAQNIDWTGLDLEVTGLRIGLCFDVAPGTRVDPEVAAAVSRAADRFAEAGAEIIPIPAYLSRDYLSEAQLPFMAAHQWSQLNDPALIDDLSKAYQPMVEGARRVQEMSPLDVIRAYDLIGPMVSETVQTLDAYDLVLSPVCGSVTGPAESMMTEELTGANFTSPLNVAGTPAASINCGFTTQGKPIGLQIAATRFEDLRVLQASAWYEGHRGEGATPDWSRLI